MSVRNRAPSIGTPRSDHISKGPHSTDPAAPLMVDSSKGNQQMLLLSSDSGHFSLARALHMADYITELNGFCGVSAVFFCLRYCLDELKSDNWLYLAITSMAMGFFFDFMDGRVARWRQKASVMGQELDSLADLISFGLAPASVAFCIGFRSALDTILLAFFVLCGLTRLARFNVTAQFLPKDASGKSKFFEGTPIPTTLALDMLMAFWINKGWIVDSLPGGVLAEGTWCELHPSVLIFVIHGCFMTSDDRQRRQVKVRH